MLTNAWATSTQLPSSERSRTITSQREFSKRSTLCKGGKTDTDISVQINSDQRLKLIDNRKEDQNVVLHLPFNDSRLV